MTRSHAQLLRRGRRLWDFAARTYYGPLEERGDSLHRLVLDRLGDIGGATVLDIGCGGGGAFAALRAAIGPGGRLVGVDHSPRMVARARRRVVENGWDNVEVREADASRTPHGSAEFDVAVALASFSAMPDVPAALTLARDALRPGGRLFVFDVRLAGRDPLTMAARGTYRALAGFTGADVLAELRRTFPHVDPVTTRGTALTIAVATR